jgi:hypothetical protein
MTKKNEAYIHWRDIVLTVVIPEAFAWDFMREFGHKFAQQDPVEGITPLRAVESYQHLLGHPNFDIKIKIWDEKETEFLEFLKKFCAERGIFFRKPE